MHKNLNEVVWLDRPSVRYVPVYKRTETTKEDSNTVDTCTIFHGQRTFGALAAGPPATACKAVRCWHFFHGFLVCLFILYPPRKLINSLTLFTASCLHQSIQFDVYLPQILLITTIANIQRRNTCGGDAADLFL